MSDELDLLADTVADGRVGRAVRRSALPVACAWRTATVRAIATGFARRCETLSAPQRVRAVGCWLLTAALADGAFSLLSPDRVSTARWTLWAGVVAAATVAAAWPREAVSAWSQWRRR